MDIRKYFGKEVAKRLLTIHSYTIEEFYYNLDTITKRGDPFIYILDSQDCLTSKYEIAKFQEQKKAHRRNKEITGSMGDGKAKVHSQNLRRAIGKLEETGSILLIVNQTRDKLVGFGDKVGRSGGHALQFYACLEIWSSVRKTIHKVYKGKKRQQGTLCELRTRKNRIRGKDRIIQMPIFHSYGMDDISSCVDYLISEGHWPKKKGSSIIKAPEFDFKGKRGALIKLIDEGAMEKDLGMIAADVWKDIEDAVAIKRKPRYD
jgi:RecA/RadA recombinase